MAVIHRGSHDLEKLAAQERDKAAMWDVLPPLVFAILGFLAGTEPVYNFIANLADRFINNNFFEAIVLAPVIFYKLLFKWVWLLICLWDFLKESFKWMFKEDSGGVYQAGLEGEKKALAVLEILPNTFHVFTNINISFDGKTSEIDTVVVGPTGVYVVETKNYKGVLSGDWSDQYLKQTKNNDVVKDPYNPVKQVGTHVFRVAGALRNKGLGEWVEGCVLFTDRDLTLRVTDYKYIKPNVYTIDDKDDLLNHILERAAKIPTEKQRKIVVFLDSLIEVS